MENYNNSTGNCQNSGEAGHMVICPIDWLSNVKEVLSVKSLSERDTNTVQQSTEEVFWCVCVHGKVCYVGKI